MVSPNRPLINLALGLAIALVLFAIAYVWLSSQSHPEYAQLWMFIVPGSILMLAGLILFGNSLFSSRYRGSIGFIAVALLNLMLGIAAASELSGTKDSILRAFGYAPIIIGIGMINLFIWDMIKKPKENLPQENDKNEKAAS